MIILLFNAEVVVLIYFRDTGCFINYYYCIIIINIIIITSSCIATYMYILYIYIYTSSSGAESTTNTSKSWVLMRKIEFKTCCIHLRVILVQPLPQCAWTACGEAIPGWVTFSFTSSFLICVKEKRTVRTMCWRLGMQGTAHGACILLCHWFSSIISDRGKLYYRILK